MFVAEIEDFMASRPGPESHILFLVLAFTVGNLEALAHKLPYGDPCDVSALMSFSSVWGSLIG